MTARWLALGLLAPAFVGGATVAASERTSSGGLYAQLLSGHNSERTQVGVPPLEWSSKLAREAQAWANQLAREGEMRHAPQEANGGAGENLWMGASGYYGPRVMMDTFLNEKRYYRHATYPQVSSTGKWEDVGHYTQIVWRQTREVGCGIARGQQHEFLVCRYWPAGNWRGQLAY